MKSNVQSYDIRDVDHYSGILELEALLKERGEQRAGGGGGRTLDLEQIKRATTKDSHKLKKHADADGSSLEMSYITSEADDEDENQDKMDMDEYLLGDINCEMATLSPGLLKKPTRIFHSPAPKVGNEQELDRGRYKRAASGTGLVSPHNPFRSGLFGGTIDSGRGP